MRRSKMSMPWIEYTKTLSALQDKIRKIEGEIQSKKDELLVTTDQSIRVKKLLIEEIGGSCDIDLFIAFLTDMVRELS